MIVNIAGALYENVYLWNAKIDFMQYKDMFLLSFVYERVYNS